ncbi:MAG: NADH:flavin oxidoreductase [Candidatus Tectomicrobia bacterium]|uniref:NADH:flavin oxidoreductase n=1 Tax=Tectimicrobiota bacterium TaxID=2528274 RepID=A0A932CNR8_UNCTE|nr:NADH:flavin oxidoreductase [Candidatus Tectomicrobia bacterium]
MSPLKIKGITLPNRIVFPAVVNNYASQEGEVTDRLIRFHQRIAANQVGLTITGATAVSPEGRFSFYSAMIHEDRFLPGLSRLFSAIREAGSVPAIQIGHTGRQTSSKIVGGLKKVAPSPIPCPLWRGEVKELTGQEVEALEDRFAAAALRARQAGAQMVEFHGAHGYLIHQFLSLLSNQRSDYYGGSLTGRTRFIANILRKSREKVGKDFLLFVRLSADEFLEGGLHLEDAQEIARILEENGADGIDVSGSVASNMAQSDEKMHQGIYLRLARGIKESVKIPVICVGKILDLDQAERALEEGCADLVAICRALIADPEFVSKSLRGEADQAVRCIECNQCLSFNAENPHMECSVNSSL